MLLHAAIRLHKTFIRFTHDIGTIGQDVFIVSLGLSYFFYSCEFPHDEGRMV